VLLFDEKLGSKWENIGGIVIDNTELTSVGLNLKEFRNLFKSFDCALPEEKELIYKFYTTNLSETVIKKNTRCAYVN
jgi:hypothetical protein